MIDVASQQVVQTIATPDHVFGFGSNVVFTPDGGRAFISATQNDQVLQVDTATYAVTAVMQLKRNIRTITPRWGPPG